MSRLLPVLLLVACLPDLGERSAAASAGRCGSCHPEEATAFDGSRHAAADTTNLFRDLRARSDDPGSCDVCHAPDDGFTCVTCHAASGNQRTADGLLIPDPTGPVRGPSGAGDGAPHATVAGDFLVDSALCGTCHELDGDGVFHETPYSRWRSSEAAARGERCQDCHMSSRPGEPAGNGDHGFVGLQTDPATLLRAGLELQRVPEGLLLVNHAGHALPDGAAFTRELWLEGRADDGAWTGRVHALHPRLEDATGQLAHDPLRAEVVVMRALQPDEERLVDWPEDLVACLRYRSGATSLVLDCL